MNVSINRSLQKPQDYASDGSDAIGFVQFWGNSPALNLLADDPQASAFGPAAVGTQIGGYVPPKEDEAKDIDLGIYEDVGNGQEGDEARPKPLPEGETINVLISAGADVRHVVKSLARRPKGLKHVRFYLHEKQHEVLARHLLFLQIVNNKALTIRERMEVFLSLYGNTLVRERDCSYVSELAPELVELITENSAHPLAEKIDLSQLKFKDRDILQDVFKGWFKDVPFDVEALREQRCRGFYRARYDYRKNLMDYDYQTFIKEVAGIIHWFHYKQFGHTGVAFETRLASYASPNRTLASYTEAMDRSKGNTVQVRGYWGDIVNSPYHGFCTRTDPEVRHRLFKINSQQYRHTETDIAEYNLTAYAQMKVRSTTLFYSVAQEALRRLPEFRERDLSITAWSYGRLELREETLILAISREAMSRDFRGKHQEIANLCWAMAQLDLRDTRLLEGMAAAALSSELRDFSSQELANSLWSFASLKVHNEALTDSFAAHVLTEVLPEAISQNIVNIAWALNCLEWKDNQGGFHRILSRFLKVCSRSLGVEWVTLASIAQERGLQSLNGFWAQFESFVLAPALRHLEALRVALSEVTFNERFQTMQRWVDEIQLPHLGPKFLTDALLAAGAQRAQSTAEWMMEARAAVADTAWWSCPKAAVSSQGVVAFLSAELQVGARRVTDPGTVYQADDAPGLVLVERLLQPIYLQVPRHGHAERRALVALLRSVLQSAAGDSTILQDTTGFVRLYASHYLCISCLAALAQLKRQLPKILLEVGCDDAWSSWRHREAEAKHVLRVGLQSES